MSMALISVSMRDRDATSPSGMIFIATGSFVRMFTAVPAHASFAVLMGYFLGKAKFTHHKELYYSFVALLVASAFHGAYDYFWFIAYVPGIWVGAIVSLIAALLLSRKAIRLHQQASPFINPPPHPPL